ncbi:MAG TPA: amidohydrolase family protein [Candidatus Lumbricidophila sp.]|nr:amidohydrolase family protein [Candidatus Lumbricidophila sp.]
MTGLIDTHVHVWDPTALRYPWLDGSADLNKPFLPAAVDRANGSTTGMVFVQCDPIAEHTLDEVRWVAGFGDAWPELRGIVAGANLRSESLVEQLDAVKSAGPVVGIRHNLQGEAIDALADPALVAGLQTVADAGLTFDVCILHPQLAAAVALLRQVPTLRFVLDHVGKPPIAEPITSPPGADWARHIAELAALPGAHVKLSGLAAEARDQTSLDAHAGGYLSHALGAFGPDRAMLGSDWPVSALVGAGGTFASWVDRVLALVDNPAEHRAVREGTATRFYGLG